MKKPVQQQHRKSWSEGSLSALPVISCAVELAAYFSRALFSGLGVKGWLVGFFFFFLLVDFILFFKNI